MEGDPGHTEPGPAARFEALYDEHRDAVYNYLRRFLPHGEWAQDGLQETFLRFWTALPTYREEGKARHFLFRIARNVALDLVRRRKREAEVLQDVGATRPGHDEGAGASGDAGPDPEVAAVVRSRVRDLPDDQREAFVLYRHHGMSYREIAGIQGVAVKTVESRLYRAMRRLARGLTPYLGDAREPGAAGRPRGTPSSGGRP